MQVGSADHHIHYYDLRNPCHPVSVFSGHQKAVSYVKFLSSNELASASTDSTLRLWDVKENLLVSIITALQHSPTNIPTNTTCYIYMRSIFQVRTFRGHTNEKNFVGLTVNEDFLACGSETNEVSVYHKVSIDSFKQLLFHQILPFNPCCPSQAIAKPVTWHKFGSPVVEDTEEDAGSYFISAVCWKAGSPTILAANSRGAIKVLALTA